MPLCFKATKSSWPPSYVEVWQWRQRKLMELRASPTLLKGAKVFYSQPENYGLFISHWCDTYDPRNSASGLPTRMPMVLFPRQYDLIEFLNALTAAEESGLIEKARDMGATWVACAYSVCLWLFQPGSAVGWGSRKEILVDRQGDPSSIFEKIRMIVRGLPKEFMPEGFNPKVHFSHMKIINPETGATITGEAGDNIGRGGRTSIYFKDESAHYERPESVEAALGDNTRVQVDMSSVKGLGTVFHRKREAGVEWEGGPATKGKTNVFVMAWSDHPAKDQEWYETRRAKAIADGLLHVFSQEVDRDYAASLEGTVIPAHWVEAAIGAASKLGFSDEGPWTAALDVADEGGDKNAFAARKGVILRIMAQWAERDTAMTARRAVDLCNPLGTVSLQYDSIGVGSGVKAETNRLRDEGVLSTRIRMSPWNAGAAVLDPDAHVDPKDKATPINKDFYANLKAQAWWNLRRRFEKTWRAVTEGAEYPSDELISIDPELPYLRLLQKELSQPTMGYDKRMRLLIDKAPEGTVSPNLADAVVMAYFPIPPSSTYTLRNL